MPVGNLDTAEADARGPQVRPAWATHRAPDQQQEPVLKETKIKGKCHEVFVSRHHNL